jgi:hypothetical protein
MHKMQRQAAQANWRHETPGQNLVVLLAKQYCAVVSKLIALQNHPFFGVTNNSYSPASC